MGTNWPNLLVASSMADCWHVRVRRMKDGMLDCLRMCVWVGGGGGCRRDKLVLLNEFGVF